MERKVRHSIKFDDSVGEAVHTVDETAVQESIESEIADEVTVVDCFSENPYDHQPYFSITVAYEQLLPNHQEVETETTEAIKTVVEDYVGSDISRHIAEGIQ